MKAERMVTQKTKSVIVALLVSLVVPAYPYAIRVVNYELILRQTENGWYLGCRVSSYMKQLDLGDKLCNSESVEKLLNAIKTPAIKQLDVVQLGITQSWLDQNAEPALEENLSGYGYIKPSPLVSPQQKDLFMNAFKDPNLAKMVLYWYYKKYFQPDDCPIFSLKIIPLDNRAEVELYSDNQHAFMIPWRITRQGKIERTYSAEISRAVYSLLPRDFPETGKKRICGSKLRWEMARFILFSEIKVEWDKLGVEHKIGKAIAPVKDKYILKTSKIASISSIDLDFDDGWHATLSDPNLPSNVCIGLFVPLQDEKLGSLKPFLEKSNYYVDLTLSVPWFEKYVKEHPEVTVEIRFVEDCSMSKKAGKSLLDDMEGNNKVSLANKIKPLLKDSCFLEIDEGQGRFSRWVVLPDRRMVLWHYMGDKVVKWNSSQFDTWNDYGFSIACTIISATGEIE
ncbi:MAG: hypothetical protein ACYSWZ_16145 [Planctomycetota bacterium]